MMKNPVQYETPTGIAREQMRDYRTARAGALRNMGMDFLLAKNRVPGVGAPFNPGQGTGFQLPGNTGIIPGQVTPGTQLSDLNPPPLTVQQIQSGMVQPDLRAPPGNPMFQGIPNKGYGFMLPQNRSNVLRTGGPMPPVQVK